MYVTTTALLKLIQLNKRIEGICGGTAASKTISILQLLIDDAQRDKVPKMYSITSESMPHLKRGAIRDFKSIMIDQGYWNDSNWNATDFIYSFPKSKIEFFSLDMPHKVRGPRRDKLFINEANNIPLETFDQLEVRTKEKIWLDWNPTNEFWFYSDVLGKRDDVEMITLTYKDNEGCPPEVVRSIEMRKGNKNWWQVYGLGQLGEVEGKIYKDWIIIDEIPHEARLERYGLDFGYSNDPTAIDAIYRYNGGWIIDEITHQKGLSNRQIADILSNQPKALIIADSAEPKSIDEIMQYGLNIIPSIKGQGSVNKGIQFVQGQRVSMTKRSLNTIKEYRNYLWQTDKDGKIINIPDVGFDHHMDGIRYAINSLNVEEDDTQLPNDSQYF